MHVIAGARQGGKTHRAVEWAEAHGGVLIVHSEFERTRLIEHYGLTDRQVHTVDSVRVRQSLRRFRPAAIGVENLDLVLPYLLGLFQPIDLVTATASSERLRAGVVL